MASPVRIVRSALVVSGLVLALLVMPAGASAAVRTWDGDAGTADWKTAANWSDDTVPANADWVVIGAGHSVEVSSGSVLTVASLQVAGTLELKPAGSGWGMSRLSVHGPILMDAGAQVIVDGDLDSSTGWTTVATGATFTTSVGIDAPFFRNEGFVNVTAGKLDIDNRFENTGTIMSLGGIQADEYVDTGVSTVLGEIFTSDAMVSGTHSFCDLSRGVWIQSTGTVTMPSLCTIEVGSYRLDAGARLRLSVHSTLSSASPVPPMKVNVAQLDGTIEVMGAWGTDLTPGTRQGTLVQAIERSGTPTIDVPPTVADGPDPWELVAWLAPVPSTVRFAIQDTIPPTAPSNLRRLEGGSIVHAAWDVASDSETYVAGYSYEITANPLTDPDAAIEVTNPELSESHAPGVWYLHVRAIDTAGNAGPTIHSDAWTVHERGEWIGAGTTNDWHEPANWVTGQVPASGADVTVMAPDPDVGVGPRISNDVMVGLLELAAPLTIDTGRHLDTSSVTMFGPADLIGGTMTASRLAATNVAPAPQMTTTISGLTIVTAQDADVTIVGSVGPNGATASGGSELAITGALTGPEIHVDEMSSLTAGSIAIPAEGTLGAGGAVTTGALTTTGNVFFMEGSELQATTVHQSGHAITSIASGVSVAGDFEVAGGVLDVRGPINGNVNLSAGRMMIERADSGPVFATTGSFTVDAAATLEYVASERFPIQVGGASRVDGTLYIYDAQPTTAWGTMEPLIQAAGGMSGTPALDTADTTPRVRLAMTGSALGLTPVDQYPPYPPIVTMTLGAADLDGRRTLMASLSPSPAMVIDNVDGLDSGITAYSVVVDAAPTTLPDDVAEYDGPDATMQTTIGLGSWYVHVRARDGEGVWGPAAHAGPFVVAAPSSTTPTGATPTGTTPDEQTPTTDRCTNIPGVQATLPVRTAARADGSCWTTSSFRADVLWGSGRGELFRSGAGNDIVRAGGGADRVFGERGNDRLFGQGGNDRLVGGPGRDRLDGGAGNDVLDARDRAGGDVIVCGPGRDVVYLDLGDRAARDCEVRRRR